ncbi:uncharacterized protein LOC143256467 isoform X2 [Tachypleus tridentatus]|uniref:uncharacterized protein LOC143256467 isoform X2 n=1 Tax=Tachypleus tridentatus TaxID=6853 RepID=UPI003FD100EA
MIATLNISPTSFGGTSRSNSVHVSMMTPDLYGSSVGVFTERVNPTYGFTYGETRKSSRPSVPVSHNQTLRKLKIPPWRLSDPVGFSQISSSVNPASSPTTASYVCPERVKTQITPSMNPSSRKYYERPNNPFISLGSSITSSFNELTNVGSESLGSSVTSHLNFTTIPAVPSFISINRKSISINNSSSSLVPARNTVNNSSTYNPTAPPCFCSSSSEIPGSSICSDDHLSSVNSHRVQLQQKPFVSSYKPFASLEKYNKQNVHRRDRVIKFRENQTNFANKPHISWKLLNIKINTVVNHRTPRLCQCNKEISRSIDSGIGSPEKRLSLQGDSPDEKLSSHDDTPEERLSLHDDGSEEGLSLDDDGSEEGLSLHSDTPEERLSLHDDESEEHGHHSLVVIKLKKNYTKEVNKPARVDSSQGADFDEGNTHQTENENKTFKTRSTARKEKIPNPRPQMLLIDDNKEPYEAQKIIHEEYKLEDFNFLKVLGRSGFGKVLLAQLKGRESYFAIKCLKKDVILEDNDLESAIIERKVLALGTNHPFLSKLFCTFQSESHLFFAMEYLGGGDLMFHIEETGKFSHERARFYAAEIVVALTFIHRNGIIYRDLKLDNVMLDSEGHIRLVDFGMCQLNVFNEDCLPSNFCGTPEYMAPELLEKEPTKRLGMPTCVAGTVTHQPFFKNVDWEGTERKQIEPPFKPILSGPNDVSNFDSGFTMETAVLTPVNTQILASIDQQQFEGFNYTNPNMAD